MWFLDLPFFYSPSFFCRLLFQMRSVPHYALDIAMDLLCALFFFLYSLLFWCGGDEGFFGTRSMAAAAGARGSGLISFSPPAAGNWVLVGPPIGALTFFYEGWGWGGRNIYLFHFLSIGFFRVQCFSIIHKLYLQISSCTNFFKKKLCAQVICYNFQKNELITYTQDI